MEKSPLVLIVEDEDLLLRAISKKLETAGMKTITATTGKQAIDYLSSLDQVPDAIWLDYYLKDMNGLDFIHELKKHDAWSEVPILVVSNSASTEKVHNMLALGVKKYILKAQYRLDEITKILNDVIMESNG